MKGVYFERNKPRLNHPSIIIVEGVDDAYFLDEVLSDIGAGVSDVGVNVAGGKDGIESLLSAILKSPSFTTQVIRRYAVIRDVDSNLAKCLKEVSSLFSRLNQTSPAKNGVITRPDGRQVGLFLMPSDTQTGSLETLALGSVADHPILAEVDKMLAATSTMDGNVDHFDKRRAQAFLSSRSSPLCNGVGNASRQGVFDIQSPILDPLKDFLRKFLGL